MADPKMTTAVTSEQYGGRTVLTENGRRRIATPMAYVESCLSRIEEEFLWRFFEAHCFKTGSKPVDVDGNPVGRYVDYADQVDPESYAKLEIQAFDWIRKYKLGKESLTVAELFLRMESGRQSLSLLDFGSSFVNTYDEKVALGGGKGAIRVLAMLIKDAYRDFFRWYDYVLDCEKRGREATPLGAQNEAERERQISQHIQNFKLAKGLLPKTDPALK
jgi:hypothetical protein